MVQTAKPTAATVSPYTVLRPICIHGERCEIGATVELTPVQYAELKAANKVGPLADTKPAKPAAKDTKPKEATP
jgi:bifunctional N-acetylglucosamine-1-phosphate-uridyltransferase/glucosamine-1-phosphate-acetyltransferase GlmU-like protein